LIVERSKLVACPPIIGSLTMLRYKPYVPQTVGDVMDFLGMMILSSPTFEDDFFIGKNIGTVFPALNQGLENIRKKLGEERYQTLRTLSDQMRAHFEADPEDKTGEAMAGRRIIREMEDVLTSTYRKRKPTPGG
jgi:hypothetical protein